MLQWLPSLVLYIKFYDYLLATAASEETVAPESEADVMVLVLSGSSKLILIMMYF
jgi:hypothetical protein